MSSHIGVSCDSCMKTNFSGRRYKCLQCDNYDLCGSCYDMNAESQSHVHTHPMQCILTKSAYELFYAGELISYRTIVSLTCPYCGQSGFISHTLLLHCLEKHSIMLSETKTTQAVMCPICVVNPLEGYQSRFVSLADHIAREHDDADLSLNQLQRIDNKKEDLEQNEDDDEELPLYILAERLFTKEDTRRQEVARQRFATTIVRTDSNNTALNRHGTSHRNTLSRHSATRGSRGNQRGHFHSYPYGTVSRATSGAFRIPFETAAEHTIPADPYTAILFSQDPLFDFDSPFSEFSNAPFFLTSSMPTHAQTLGSSNNDRLVQKKPHITSVKHKRYNPIQQQPTQTMILTEPSTINNHALWSHDAHSIFSSTNFLTDPSITTEHNKTHDHLLKHPEDDSRSLLGKSLKADHGNEPKRAHSDQDYSSFLQSLLFSLMNSRIDKD